MTLTIMPGETTTSSGNPLPCVAVPQGELLTVNENNIPLLRDTLAPGVHIKPLRLDLEAGCWVVLAPSSRLLAVATCSMTPGIAPGIRGRANHVGQAFQSSCDCPQRLVL